MGRQGAVQWPFLVRPGGVRRTEANAEYVVYQKDLNAYGDLGEVPADSNATRTPPGHGRVFCYPCFFLIDKFFSIPYVIVFV